MYCSTLASVGLRTYTELRIPFPIRALKNSDYNQTSSQYPLIIIKRDSFCNVDKQTLFTSIETDTNS